MIATVSLYFYELHGIEKCAHFIDRGKDLEDALGVRGSFTNRPHKIFGIVSELLPSAVIYPASLAGWAFLVVYDWRWFGVDVRIFFPAAVFVIAVLVSSAAIRGMEGRRSTRRKDLERKRKAAEEQRDGNRPSW